jgi:hypothetical protein
MFAGRRPRTHLAKLALVAVVMLLPTPDAAAQRAIAVGADIFDPAPGIFETVHWLDENAPTFRLPALRLFDTSCSVSTEPYRETEEAVHTAINQFLDSNNDVVLIGHSHGAELILRVMHRLAREGIEPQKLRKVKLGLIDVVSDCYPFEPYFSVPAGTGGALSHAATAR